MAVEWASEGTVPIGTSMEEWKAFNTMAADVHRRALARCGRPQQAPRRAVRAKGTDIAVVRQQDRGLSRELDATIPLRRLANWLGRVAELRRQQQAGAPDQGLRRRTQDAWPRQVPRTSNLAQAEAAGLRLRAQLRQQIRTAKVGQWRDNMAAQGRFATSWLQGKFGLGGPPAIQREDGSRTATIGEGFAELVSFWSRIWHREAGSEELDRLRAGTLTRGPPVRAHEWRLTAQDLQAVAASKRHGAAGPDGWTGEEVYAWPAYAWELFLDVWHRWAERDSWPRPMRCYRQIFMAKEKGEGADSISGNDIVIIHVKSLRNMRNFIMEAPPGLGEEHHKGNWCHWVALRSRRGNLNGMLAKVVPVLKPTDLVMPGIGQVPSPKGGPPMVLEQASHEGRRGHVEAFLQVHRNKDRRGASRPIGSPLRPGF